MCLKSKFGFKNTCIQVKKTINTWHTMIYVNVNVCVLFRIVNHPAGGSPLSLGLNHFISSCWITSTKSPTVFIFRIKTKPERKTELTIKAFQLPIIYRKLLNARPNSMTGIERASSINRSVKNDRRVNQIAEAIELAEDRKDFRQLRF